MTALDLSGRVALVTGANNPRGIGAAIAHALAVAGARVFVHGYRGHQAAAAGDSEQEAGEALFARLSSLGVANVVERLRGAGCIAAGLEADLSAPESASYLLSAAEGQLGPVSILVNNAASWAADTFVPVGASLASDHVETWTDRPRPLTATTFDQNFVINTRAAGLLMAAYTERHVARGAAWGRIINISTAGARAFPSEVSYGASKFALEGLTRSAALELGQFGITVNAIAPGPVQTGWITPTLEARLLPTIPLGRLGQPEDVADVVLFLASDLARWLTGQCFYVGGGHGI